MRRKWLGSNLKRLSFTLFTVSLTLRGDTLDVRFWPKPDIRGSMLNVRY